MVADVSGLVNMLAAQPGQNIAQLGQTLQQAETDRAKASQLKFDNERQTAKDALAERLTNKQIQQADLAIMKDKIEIISPILGSMLQQQDPMARQEAFNQAIPTLQQAGVDEAGIEGIRANLGDNEFLAMKLAQGMGAKDQMALYQGSSTKPSIAKKKTAELIQAAKDRGEYTPGYDYVAEGIAYGAYKQFQDPTTGDVILRDNRTNARLTHEQSVDILEQMPSESQFGMARPITVTKGNKEEVRLQKNVKDLSKDMGKTGAPRLENILGKIEGIVEATYKDGEGDLPGYGITAMAPDWAVTQEAQDLRQATVKLFNVELAERSGAAVTKQELDRLKDEFKSGAWKTDRQFVEGIKAYRSLLEDYKKAVFAGYDDKVKSRYWEQEGLALKGATEEEMPDVESTTITEEQIRVDAKANNWTEEQIQSAIKTYGAK